MTYSVGGEGFRLLTSAPVVDRLLKGPADHDVEQLAEQSASLKWYCSYHGSSMVALRCGVERGLVQKRLNGVRSLAQL